MCTKFNSFTVSLNNSLFIFSIINLKLLFNKYLDDNHHLLLSLLLKNALIIFLKSLLTNINSFSFSFIINSFEFSFCFFNIFFTFYF